LKLRVRYLPGPELVQASILR